MKRFIQKLFHSLKRFIHKSQKVEFIETILKELENKLTQTNPNKVYNNERDRLYGYECELRGEIPYRKHFNIQMDESTVAGGVYYHFKHYLLNLDPSTSNDDTEFDEEFVEERNDVLKSTIEDYLEKFKGVFQDNSGYELAVNSLISFFRSNPKLPTKPIFVKRGVKTKLAKELGKLYQITVEKPTTKDYLVFLKGLFSSYSNEDLDSKPLQFTNMYKYSTTKKH